MDNLPTNIEKKALKVQVRISPSERILLRKLMEANKELTISKMFRDSLYENCKKHGIISG